MRGQSYPNFVFKILPLGNIPETFVQIATLTIDATYGVACECLEEIALPDDCFLEERTAYETDRLSNYVRDRIPKETRVVFLTDAFLYHAANGLLAEGVSDLGLPTKGTVSIISSMFPILRFISHGNIDLFNKEICITLIHEIGHALGVGHCDSPECVMRPGGKLFEPDKTAEYCPKCHADIFIHLDLANRYAELEKMPLGEKIQWYKDYISFLKKPV